MAVRVIYYTNDDLIKHGDLELRRKSVVYEENSFEHEGLFRLEELEKGWRITPLKIEEQPLFSDEKLISGQMDVKNGFTFNSADTFFKVIAEFPKARLSSKNKLFFRITALLTALILIAEAILVIWLPKQLDSMSDLHQKVVIQQCEKELDAMRGQLRRWKGEKKSLTVPAAAFILKRLNQVADYFRDNRELFSMEEVNLMRKRLDDYRDLVGRLEQGIDFDQRVEPDIEGWITKSCKIEE